MLATVAKDGVSAPRSGALPRAERAGTPALLFQDQADGQRLVEDARALLTLERHELGHQPRGALAVRQRAQALRDAAGAAPRRDRARGRRRSARAGRARTLVGSGARPVAPSSKRSHPLLDGLRAATTQLSGPANGARAPSRPSAQISASVALPFATAAAARRRAPPWSRREALAARQQLPVLAQLLRSDGGALLLRRAFSRGSRDGAVWLKSSCLLRRG